MLEGGAAPQPRLQGGVGQLVHALGHHYLDWAPGGGRGGEAPGDQGAGPLHHHRHTGRWRSNRWEVGYLRIAGDIKNKVDVTSHC